MDGITRDDQTAKTLDKIRKVAVHELKFRLVQNRSDGMLQGYGAWSGWTMETSFVHGEGTLRLHKDRTAGGRTTSFSTRILVRGKMSKDEIADLFGTARIEESRARARADV